MKKSEVIALLDKHNIEWTDEGMLNDPNIGLGLNIRFTKKPERLVLMHINEKNGMCVFTYFKDNERELSASQTTEIVINGFLELHTGNWEFL